MPALVIFAIWMDKSADPAVRKAAEAYFTRIDALVEKQAQAWERSVSTARVIRLRGARYIFLSNESDVLREIRVFLAGLK